MPCCRTGGNAALKSDSCQLSNDQGNTPDPGQDPPSGVSVLLLLHARAYRRTTDLTKVILLLVTSKEYPLLSRCSLT